MTESQIWLAASANLCEDSSRHRSLQHPPLSFTELARNSPAGGFKSRGHSHHIQPFKPAEDRYAARLKHANPLRRKVRNPRRADVRHDKIGMVVRKCFGRAHGHLHMYACTLEIFPRNPNRFRIVIARPYLTCAKLERRFRENSR